MVPLWHSDEVEVLEDPQRLEEFVSEVREGKRGLSFQSQKPVSEKHSQKLVGDDFEKRVLNADTDTLVLVYHPVAEKNRGLKQRFERYASRAGAHDVKMARMNGVNESPVFKVPSKLPALVLFRSKLDGSKEVVEYHDTRRFMLKSSSDAQF
jgi:hypothetical protein